MRNTLYNFIAFVPVMFVLAAAPARESCANDIEQTTQNETPLLKYNPQRRNTTHANTPPVNQERTTNKRQGTPFRPEKFLKHSGRIHYEQDKLDNTGPKRRATSDNAGKKQHKADKADISIKPARKPETTDEPLKTASLALQQKPELEPQAGEPDREAKTRTRPAKKAEQIGRPKAGQVDVTPAQKPMNVRKRAKQKRLKTSAHSRNSQKRFNSATKTKTPKESISNETASQMPAVPAGDVKSDKLRGYELPMPPQDETSSQNGVTSHANRLQDRALKRMMLRPDTKRLVASVRNIHNSNATKAASEPETKENKHFVQIPQQGKGDYRLIFENGLKELNTTMRDHLRRDVVDAMQHNPDSRLIIKSYATPTGSSQSSDRRIALARALKLREFLIKQELETSRINIRALGDSSNAAPYDRVDLHIASP